LRDTVECLESLKKISYPDYEVVLVDNASAGDEVARLRERFGEYAHIIENDRNYGYTGGNNIGMRFCLADSRPDHVLILNNDLVVAPDFLDHLVAAAEAEPTLGIAGAKVCFYDYPDLIQSAGAKISMWRGRMSFIGLKQKDRGQFDTEHQVDCVSGSCLLIKTEVIEKVGMFDESFFAYWDEADYCTRVRKAGYTVKYVPRAKVWHKNPIKQRVWERTPRGRGTTLRYYYSGRNNIWFMRKHASGIQYLSFLICFLGCEVWLMSATCLLYHRDPARLVAFYRGVKDGLCSAIAKESHQEHQSS